MSTGSHPTVRGPMTRMRPSMPCHPARAALERRPAMDDSGMTLTELMIASTLLIVLLTAVMITMNLLNTVSSSVSAQYQEYDQALPAFAALQTLLRAEVEPGPPQSGVPVPGFLSVENFSLTFYANIGTAYHNVTWAGTTAGPAKIVALELDANGNAVTSATRCDTTNLCSFQVREYLPDINAAACLGLGLPVNTVCSTCPVTGQTLTSPVTGQPWVCTYTGPYKLLSNVLGVANDPSQQGGVPSAPTQPIFTYNVFDPVAQVGSTLTATQVQTASTWICNSTTCNADNIQSVGVELMVARKGAGTNGTVDDQTIVYRYAKSPGASTSPYQYTSTAG
jgi:type II secretory pathway component PulJ